MQSSDDRRAMDQKIFKLGLPMEAVSLYLLCCHLEDTQTAVSIENVEELWNGDGSALTDALHALESRRVLARTLSAAGETAVYRINPADDWKA